MYTGIAGGSDFQQRSEAVMLSPLDTHFIILIEIFSDNLLEGEERFSVFIASSNEYITTTQSTAQITIMDSSEGNDILATMYHSLTRESPCVVHLPWAKQGAELDTITCTQRVGVLPHIL